MNGLIALCGILALLLLLGAAIGMLDRERFVLRWLLVAALLVAINDALLTRVYGTAPDLLAGSDLNWQGKVLALVATLAIAAHRKITWRKVGLTLAHAPGSLRAALPVVLLYCTFFVAIALAFPSGTASAEDVAFQLTMPGLEEEPFYRGLLLFVLGEAYTGRTRFLGVDWSWGAVLSWMAHAFGFSDGHFSFDTSTMALTAVPAFIAVWLRLRTGSLLLPIVLHNFGNAITMLL
jgi:membrane protease YdiL (CAAX protease family)